jgi:hypothetical protein
VEHRRAVGRGEEREDQRVPLPEAPHEARVARRHHQRQRREQHIDEREAARRQLAQKERIAGRLEDGVTGDDPEEHEEGFERGPCLAFPQIHEPRQPAHQPVAG